MAIDLSNYKTVPERIAEFAAKHPEGVLRPADPRKPYEIVTVEGETFIVYVAAAYRSPEDRLPGIGCAWEPFPGKTPYTKDSELQNAETSAWGRAIVAALASDTSKGIATQDEVRNRQAAEFAEVEGENRHRVATLRADVRPSDVGRMRLAEVRDRLVAADLSPAGTLGEQRARLVEYLERSSAARVNEAGPPAEGALALGAETGTGAAPGATDDGWTVQCFAEGCPAMGLPGTEYCVDHSG